MFNKFYTVDFTLLAAVKYWIPVKDFSDLISKVRESYKEEYCDLSEWSDEAVAKVLVERWLEHNQRLELFDLKKLIYYMDPSKTWEIKFGNELLPYYCSCLRAICEILTLTESKKLPGFSDWLIAQGLDKENEETKLIPV